MLRRLEITLIRERLWMFSYSFSPSPWTAAMVADNLQATSGKTRLWHRATKCEQTALDTSQKPKADIMKRAQNNETKKKQRQIWGNTFLNI